MRLAAALVVTGLIGASAALYTPKAEARVYVGIGIPAPVVVAPRVVAPAYYGPRVVVGYPRVGYVGPYGWGYGGGWRYGYHAYYGHPGWGYGGGYHYHR